MKSVRHTIANGGLNRQHLQYQTSALVLVILLIMGFLSFVSAEPTKWVGTWSTAPQLVETNNNPPSPGLSNNTLRQIVRVSIGGDTLRLRFSNEFSTKPVTMNSVHVAISTGGGAIDTATDKSLFFNGSPNVTMEAGKAVTSDPFQFTLPPRADIAITIYFGATSPDVTGHPGSRTTSYLLTGNAVTRADCAGAVTTDHWYVINTIDVKAPDSAAAVVILGNSITDGRGSGTNKQNRWPDELARRFQENPATRLVAVLNQGIGGNCVLSGGLGPTALSRFERDVLNQSGVRWLIIFEGINDIGNGAPGVGNQLIDAYKQMIVNAHSRGIFVYGATLLPMKGSFYYSTAHEAERKIVNDWIRNSGFFDGVIDLDRALRNPADTLSLLPEADSGDHLHPNEVGHRLIAEAVDLNLFIGREPLDFTDESMRIYFEPECAIVGENWDILTDSQASNGKYVTVKAGMQSLDSAPSGDTNAIHIPFSVDSAGSYYLYARLNCPSYDDDSYWVKMDGGNFQMFNGLVTTGWEWKNLSSYTLTKGEHKLTITYREDGAKLDKICLSNSAYAPIGMGDEAENICSPAGMGLDNSLKVPDRYALRSNYPNPFNPTTTIAYQLSETAFVRLAVYNMNGQLVENLIAKEQSAGYYDTVWNATNYSSGIYLYKFQAGNFQQVGKCLLLK